MQINIGKLRITIEINTGQGTLAYKGRARKRLMRKVDKLAADIPFGTLAIRRIKAVRELTGCLLKDAKGWHDVVYGPVVGGKDGY